MLIAVTLASVAFAIVMTIVAWRATTEERRRSAARVAALAREIHVDRAADRHDDRSAEAVALQLPLRTPERDGVRSEREGFSRAAPDLFTTQPAPRAGSRYAVALAAAGFVVASVAAAAIVFGGGSETAASTRAAAPAAAATAGATLPLELVTLTHDRTADALTVRGVVRNPGGGLATDHLTAVVSVFDPVGAPLASGRAAVDSPSLIPGGESTFVVTIPLPGDVGRYRVSFRSGDRIVAHVDKRSRS